MTVNSAKTSIISKLVTCIAALICVLVLVSCGTNGDQGTEPPDETVPVSEEIEETVSEEHLLEMASSYWGFGAMSNWVMSTDSGFFCITREFGSDHTAIYPTWYDPDSMQKKSLNSEELMSYFEAYQLFTAGDRLIACTEDNSRINVIYPPYDEVSESYQLIDDSGKTWYISYMSAIVYDRAQDAVFCSVTDEDYVTSKNSSLCRIDLGTGKVTLLLTNGANEKYLLFGCYSDGLILMEGRNHNQMAYGQASVILYDLGVHDGGYAGEELNVEKDEYTGYAFGAEKIYYICQNKLMSYDYRSKKITEADALEAADKLTSQIPVDGRIHLFKWEGSEESEDSRSASWFDTNTVTWLTLEPINEQLETDLNYSPVFGMGYYREQGKWYVIAEIYDISGTKTEYLFCEKDKYWSGNYDFLRIG